MILSEEQAVILLNYVATSKTDKIDCDGCFEHLAEFVEHELLGLEMPEAMKVIERHIDQCPCCADEHNALLEGMKTIAV